MKQFEGAKYDDGKLKYSGSENWRSISPDRWHEALLRHVREIWEDPCHIDEESGLPSLWHLATNAAFLCACLKDKLENEALIRGER